MIALLLMSLAAAEDLSTGAFVPKPVAGRPVADMRIGAQSIDGKHPYICAEGSPTRIISLEACGNGAGVFHNDDTPDMMHLRVRGRAAHTENGRYTAEMLIGAGLTEVARTADPPGLSFGEASGPEQVEAAGGELSVSGKARVFLTPAAYAVIDVNVGAAAIPGAPMVMGKGGPIVPFATATVGVGF